MCRSINAVQDCAVVHYEGSDRDFELYTENRPQGLVHECTLRLRPTIITVGGL